MKVYVCEITEFCLDDDTMTIKIPQELKINGCENVFVVDIQNSLIKRETKEGA